MFRVYFSGGSMHCYGMSQSITDRFAAVVDVFFLDPWKVLHLRVFQSQLVCGSERKKTTTVLVDVDSWISSDRLVLKVCLESLRLNTRLGQTGFNYNFGAMLFYFLVSGQKPSLILSTISLISLQGIVQHFGKYLFHCWSKRKKQVDLTFVHQTAR